MLPFFIARRYLFAKKSHNVINIISGISAAGMALYGWAEAGLDRLSGHHSISKIDKLIAK